jgi:hypothetical protein
MNIVKQLAKVFVFLEKFIIIVLIIGPLHATVEDLSFYRYKSSVPINQVHDANFDRCLQDISMNDDRSHCHQELANTMNESMRL